MPQGLHRPRLSRLLSAAGTVALTLTALTCRDAGLAPGLPARTSIAIAPSFQRATVPGGPTFESLRSVRGILTPADGRARYEVDARFTNDTATLVFDIVFPGTSQRYSLNLAAIDTAGDTLFRSNPVITARPGTSRAIDETLRYVGADTAVAFLGLLTSDTAVLAGDSIVVTAQGYDARTNGISPLHVGWATRDGATLTVESRGPATARIFGGGVESDAWIVARIFNGTSDSVRVRSPLRVATLTLSADTLRLITGNAVAVTAVARDENGRTLDRTVEWSSGDPSVATVAEGTVTALAEGTTTVVAAAAGRSATMVVHVSPPPIAWSIVDPRRPGSWRSASRSPSPRLPTGPIPR